MLTLRTTLRRALPLPLLAALFALVGCNTPSSITALQPLQTDTYWILVDAPPATVPVDTTLKSDENKNWTNAPASFADAPAQSATTSAPATTAAPTTSSRNYTFTSRGIVSTSTTSAPANATAPFNTPGHRGDGQTVGYSDVHADFPRRPDTNPADNIWAAAMTATAPSSQPAPATATTRVSSQGSNHHGGDVGFSDIAATTSQPATTPVDAPLIFRGETPPPAPPGKIYVKRERTVDPNQTGRFIYRANYDDLWNASMLLLADLGYTIDRRDYRLGVILTQPEFSAHLIEPWRRDQTTAAAAAENTMHSQRRSVRITIQKAPNPAFYEVAVQVLIDREINPRESVGEYDTFRGTSPGFGHEKKTLRSDYMGVTDIPETPKAAAEPAPPAPSKKTDWFPVGRDPALEQKLLTDLFTHL
jgi:hypothetical protein